ncbi:hypothetical protein VTI74DRAFT_6587 [Chaetomium olivicolor]
MRFVGSIALLSLAGFGLASPVKAGRGLLGSDSASQALSQIGIGGVRARHDDHKHNSEQSSNRRGDKQSPEEADAAAAAAKYSSGGAGSLLGSLGLRDEYKHVGKYGSSQSDNAPGEDGNGVVLRFTPRQTPADPGVPGADAIVSAPGVPTPPGAKDEEGDSVSGGLITRGEGDHDEHGGEQKGKDQGKGKGKGKGQSNEQSKQKGEGKSNGNGNGEGQGKGKDNNQSKSKGEGKSNKGQSKPNGQKTKAEGQAQGKDQTQSKGKGKGKENGGKCNTARHECLHHEDIDELVNAYQRMLSKWDDADAKYLSDNFVDTSDSINILAGIPLGGPTFPTKQAFIDHQHTQPDNLPLVITHRSPFNCDEIALIWQATFGVAQKQVRGVTILGATKEKGYWQIKSIDVEFNNIAYLEDIGGTWAPPAQQQQ